MTDSLKAFLNSIAYHVDDVPMLSSDEAYDVINEWKDEGIPVPDSLTPQILFEYHNGVLNDRYPVNAEPLKHALDRKIRKYLEGIGWDFVNGLAKPITYVQSWFAVDRLRSGIDCHGDCCPASITPFSFMRWVNYHHERTGACRLWIIESHEMGCKWFGPFESLDYLGRSSKRRSCVVYRYADALDDGDEITVNEWHSIVCKDPGFTPPI